MQQGEDPLPDNNSALTAPLEPYEAPSLVVLGSVSELTLNGCYWGKQFGGTDGFTFMGISVPISKCST
jgi:hypothetical protein